MTVLMAVVMMFVVDGDIGSGCVWLLSVPVVVVYWCMWLSAVVVVVFSGVLIVVVIVPVCRFDSGCGRRCELLWYGCSVVMAVVFLEVVRWR